MPLAERCFRRCWPPRQRGARADELVERVRRMMAATPVAGMVGALAAMRDRHDSTGLLPTLAGLPTLVIVGEEDALDAARWGAPDGGGHPGRSAGRDSRRRHISPRSSARPRRRRRSESSCAWSGETFCVGGRRMG